MGRTPKCEATVSYRFIGAVSRHERIVKDLPEEGLAEGAVGVVVAEFDDPVEAYEIEFCNEDGVTTAQVAVTPDRIAKVS